MQIKHFFIILFIFTSIYGFSQNSYWKYESTKSILVTAIDIEASINLFTKNDFVEYNQNSDEAILYMYEGNMKPFNLNKANKKEDIIKYQFKISENNLKILIRSGVDNIYMVIFKKTNISEKEFNKKIQELKD